MQQWFNNLQRNEQLMLLVGAAAVTVYLLYVVLWRPMATSVDTLQRQNQAAEKSLHNVKRLVTEYRQLQGSGAGKRGSRQNLTRLIDSTVKKNELTMNRFQPSSSGDVQVRFENAVFNNVLAWLNELEAGNGVIVKDLSISPGAASGLVNISVRLRQGG